MDFTPGPHHIIIGRGRVCKMHSGNCRFDKMIAGIAAEYQAANCKADKGNILSKLIDEIHSAGPDAGFVKKDPATGRWLQVDESLARTTAAQAIRNYLHSEYRSSKQFKQKRRLQQIRDGLIPTSGTNRAAKAYCVSPDSSDDEESVSNPPRPQLQQDTFGILFSAFGASARSDDPFAPTPILVKSPSNGQLSGSLLGMEPTPIVSPQVATAVKALTGHSSSILESYMPSIFQV